MTLRPEVYCAKCGVKVPYKLESSMEETSVQEVSFKFLETRALCRICGERVYVPAVNDKNVYERHKAYYAKLDELRELEEPDDVKGA